MKDGIHPQVFQDAKTTCTTCDSVFAIPSTIKEQKVESCRNCHPVYTGKKQKEMKGGRIERFRKRMAAGRDAPEPKAAGAARPRAAAKKK
ncbi:MAG: 50S ribosomal protein L31 [Candidatus Peribacteraceae bacterium]|nr:50S ribosomal protein L31 [Candidatus Peribacteraceae bacterium]